MCSVIWFILLVKRCSWTGPCTMSGNWTPCFFVPQANFERGWDNAINGARCPSAKDSHDVRVVWRGIRGTGQRGLTCAGKIPMIGYTSSIWISHSFTTGISPVAVKFWSFPPLRCRLRKQWKKEWNSSNWYDHLIIVLSVWGATDAVQQIFMQQWRKGQTFCFGNCENGWWQMVMDGWWWWGALCCGLNRIHGFNLVGRIMDQIDWQRGNSDSSGWSSTNQRARIPGRSMGDRMTTVNIQSMSQGHGFQSFTIFKISSCILSRQNCSQKFGHLSRCEVNYALQSSQFTTPKASMKKCKSSSPSSFIVYSRAVDDVPTPSVFLVYLANVIPMQMYVATYIDRSLASLNSSAWGDLELEGSLKLVDQLAFMEANAMNVLCTLRNIHMQYWLLKNRFKFQYVLEYTVVHIKNLMQGCLHDPMI